MHATLPKKQHLIRLIVVMIIIPIMAESLYSPGLPALAESFQVSIHSAENTLSIFLLGFAIGNLFWGHVSDVIGRRPVVMTGFTLFIIATWICCQTQEFEYFMLARLLQAFGGSVSCCAQSINRDLFSQKERIAVSAFIGTSVSLTPAWGALIGGYVITFFEWRVTFWILLVTGMLLTSFLYYKLPETKQGNRLQVSPQALLGVSRKIFSDSNLLVHSTMIGLGLGIMYTFLGEGAFYCITELGMSSAAYSVICALGALSYASGCQLANFLIQRGLVYKKVMTIGLFGGLATYSIFLQSVYLKVIKQGAASVVGVWFEPATIIILLLWMIGSVCLALVLTPSFAMVLENQKDHSGVAASWFGCINNGLNASINATMSVLHSTQMWVMPLFFMGICVLMIIVFFTTLDKSGLEAENMA